MTGRQTVKKKKRRKPFRFRFQRTFSSDSIHLLMAGTDEPVRSLSAAMAFLMRTMVVMVTFGMGGVC